MKNEIVSKSAIEKLEEFRWCGGCCGSGQLVDGGESSYTYFTCIKCKGADYHYLRLSLNLIGSATTCIKHRVLMHTGITCDEYDEFLEEDMEGEFRSEYWKECYTKPCPNCGISIEKSDGCDHMTCAYCYYEFCWICLADYGRITQLDNKQHKPACKYYGWKFLFIFHFVEFTLYELSPEHRLHSWSSRTLFSFTNLSAGNFFASYFFLCEGFWMRPARGVNILNILQLNSWYQEFDGPIIQLDAENNPILKHLSV